MDNEDCYISTFTICEKEHPNVVWGDCGTILDEDGNAIASWEPYILSKFYE